MYNHSLYWFDDPQYLDMWKRYPEADNGIAERRYNLFNLCRSVADLTGDTVECGLLCGAGRHIIMSAAGGKSQHHILDSFEGLSEPGAEDETKALTPHVWKKHDLSVPKEQVRRNLAVFEDRTTRHKSWIPTRFNDVENRSFRLVHIDVDFYPPICDALAFFYEHMVSGGLIVCDDYGSTICPGAKQAFAEYMQRRPEIIVHPTTGQGFIAKQ